MKLLTILCCVLIPVCSDRTARIIGGVDTPIEDIPYQVSLEYNGNLACGGAIANRNYIITAAHCVLGIDNITLTVRSGTSERESGGSVHTVTTINAHELFSFDTIDYDIAVVRIYPPILKYDETRQPIYLTSREPGAGDVGFVSGWGMTDANKPELPKYLQSVKLPVADRNECNRVYNGTITPRMLCSDYPGGGRAPCHSDSGGPYVVDDVLVGVVSWSFGCAEPGVPAVYSNVYNLRDWINQKIDT